MSNTCHPYHDWFTATLTGFLCCGLVVSYFPQHYRIIHKGSSEGFSPWFLLLGSTSSAAGLLNMITMQWGILKCCRAVGVGSCFEMTAGVLQVGLQWLLFTTILVLYIIYYPAHLKYLSIDISAGELGVDNHNAQQGDAVDHNTRLLGYGQHAVVQTKIKTDEWKLSIVLAWVVVVHLFLTSLITFILLSFSPATSRWATFLGLSSALLAVIQYAPQLFHTYNLGLVGALSIPMMCMQSPGAVAMVLSIALRPGTNWTSWITFAVSGIMQGSLLVMCIVWKLRQRKLGVDDFGHSLSPNLVSDPGDRDQVNINIIGHGVTGTIDLGPRAPLLAVADAVDVDGYVDVDGAGEATPLLGRTKKGDRRGGLWRGWMGWFRK